MGIKPYQSGLGWYYEDESTTPVPPKWENMGYSHILPYSEPVQKGWICPLCGRANAPWLAQCTCEPQKIKIVYTNTSDSTAGPHPSASTSYTSET